ncbi:MATE family Na+-driven efflux transporter [Vibrio vulnificus]|uniref:MATE family Na+-driven efflux transporter n=1 Tax=Vibrio TaxID=662 RepID=UPI0002DE0715|nr:MULTISPECIES: MATE family Na+-driven efflux transporter [Vibrio]ASM95447.1 multidrug transporter [Vibrio vulnificus NBRC 15645 = ATCC 27562]EGR0046186.1 multidrug transporter [Vibrio vulnificus]EHY9870158.1 multidrug transporter [Vibrio vulnificus]EIC2761112.1 multidrug transporter [Vibrio vulnificus]EIN9355273.1 multidrug transporter [Vibrio vulnificus]
MFFPSLKAVNYKLLFILLLSGLIPAIYSTSRVYFLGSIPDTWAFSIAAQVAWLNVGYEVINEAMLIPLAYILGQVITSNTEGFTKRLNGAMVAFVAVYAAVTLSVLLLAPDMTQAMQQSRELIEQTTHYIRLESVAIFISSVVELCLLVLVLKDEQRKLYAFIAVKSLLIIGFDSLFVSQLSHSLLLGVNGVAYTNIVVNSILLVCALCWFHREGLFNPKMAFNSVSWMKEWAKIGAKSGLESFVRNAAFIIMILQLVNQVQQAGIFWVSNQFIWGWLLLPVMALGQLIKRDAACSNGLSVERVNVYFKLTGLVVLCWLLSVPLWDDFIAHIMGVSDHQQVTDLVLLMLGFYVVFAFNNVIDSYFYGIGRTDLMLYQSLAVNTLFYGSAFVAYQLGWFEPTLEGIALMFGVGITFDAIITIGLYRWLRANQGYESVTTKPALG